MPSQEELEKGLMKQLDDLERRAANLRGTGAVNMGSVNMDAVEKLPALAEELRAMSGAIGNLEAMVARVEERFTPVMRVIQDAQPASDAPEPERPRCSEVVKLLQDKRMAITSLSERLSWMLERSDV